MTTYIVWAIGETHLGPNILPQRIAGVNWDAPRSSVRGVGLHAAAGFKKEAGASASPPPSYSREDASRKLPGTRLTSIFSLHSLYGFPGSPPMRVKVKTTSITGLTNPSWHKSYRFYLCGHQDFPSGSMLLKDRALRRMEYRRSGGVAYADEPTPRRVSPARLVRHE